MSNGMLWFMTYVLWYAQPDILTIHFMMTKFCARMDFQKYWKIKWYSFIKPNTENLSSCESNVPQAKYRYRQYRCTIQYNTYFSKYPSRFFRCFLDTNIRFKSFFFRYRQIWKCINQRDHKISCELFSVKTQPKVIQFLEVTEIPTFFRLFQQSHFTSG